MNFRPAIQSHNERWPLAFQHQTTTVIIGMFSPRKNRSCPFKKEKKRNRSRAPLFVGQYLRNLFSPVFCTDREQTLSISVILLLLLLLLLSSRSRRSVTTALRLDFNKFKAAAALTHARTLCTALFSSRYCSIFHYHKCATGATTATVRYEHRCVDDLRACLHFLPAISFVTSIS